MYGLTLQVLNVLHMVIWKATEGLFTETRYGFEVDGVEMKCRQDFAAKAWDYRGVYKNPGL
jgi:hypothetical protein